MRTATVVVLALVAALAAGSAAGDESAFIERMTKQQKVLRLFYHVQQPTIIPEEREIANTYKPIDHLDNYEDKEVVELFWKYYTRFGFLPRGEVFSVFYEKHLPQAKGLFDVLYHAKDFDTFYKTAVWAREHINEGLFSYALTVAVIHRNDTKHIALPPPYEIYPQLFVHADVIQKAQDARLRGEVSSKEKPYIFYANHSVQPLNNGEELVSYFTEDVGLNTFFSYQHYEQPFWMNPANYSLPQPTFLGEKFFFILHYILARYHLERLSNNLPDVKPIDYKHPVVEGYYPELRLHNGREAPARPEGVYPRNIDILYVDELENYERRIRDAIDLGFALGHNAQKFDLREDDKSNILGNIIEGNVESINEDFYGSVYRNLISLFGHIVDPVHKYGVPASVLEQLETQLRDPLFYRIAKRVLSIFYQYKNKLRPYTKTELGFPGVTVESIVFDKLVTYLEDFDVEINNAVSLQNPEEGANLHFVARQRRLNHKPFYYHLKIKSEKEAKALVRVFIGPKYDVYGRELTLDERKNHYYLLDLFEKELVAGENEIQRRSEQFPLYYSEEPHFSQLYEDTEALLRGENVTHWHIRGHSFLPQRLALPRGTPAGLPLSVFVIVAPDYEERPKHGPLLMDFPFDRRIDYFEFDVPNARFDEAVVVFRRQQDINSTV